MFADLLTADLLVECIRTELGGYTFTYHIYSMYICTELYMYMWLKLNTPGGRDGMRMALQHRLNLEPRRLRGGAVRPWASAFLHPHTHASDLVDPTNSATGGHLGHDIRFLGKRGLGLEAWHLKPAGMQYPSFL